MLFHTHFKLHNETNILWFNEDYYTQGLEYNIHFFPSHCITPTSDILPLGISHDIIDK